MASENLKTRSGKTPNQNELPYDFTTSEVEDYLQDKVDSVLARSGNSEKVDIRVYTTEAGKSFLPFVVVLPMSALDEKRRKKNSKMPSIFDTKETDGSANLKSELYKLFISYAYNKDDEGAFFSDDWRRARHVNRETSPVLKSLRTPKVQHMENGRTQVITFMIDPIRIFHDMLVISGDNRDFKVDVTGWQKLQTGEFRYYLKRVVSKGGKGKKYRDTLAAELNRKMRGSR